MNLRNIECPAYAAHRNPLLADLQPLIPDDFNALNKNKTLLTNLLIKGMKNERIDKKIFKISSN